jgi:hypothetical protein
MGPVDKFKDSSVTVSHLFVYLFVCLFHRHIEGNIPFEWENLQHPAPSADCKDEWWEATAAEWRSRLGFLPG